MSDLKNIINKLIAEDQLSEALDKLEEHGNNVSSLNGRLTRLKQQQIKGTISFADYNIAKNQISESILSALDNNTINENLPNEESLPTYYDKILNELKNNKIIAWFLILFAVLSAILVFNKNIPSQPIPKKIEKSYIVIGQVVEDTPSNNPIDTVSIIIQELPDLIIKSDAKGDFTIALNSKEDAKFNFLFEHNLYETGDKIISVNSNTDTLFIGTIKLTLKPKPKKVLPPPDKPQKHPPKKKKKTFAIEYRIRFGEELSQLMPIKQSIIDTLKYHLNKNNLDYSVANPTYTIIITTEKAPKEYYSGKFEFSGSQLKVLLNEKDCYIGTTDVSMVPYIVPNSKGQFKKDYARAIDATILKNLPELLKNIKTSSKSQ